MTSRLAEIQRLVPVLTAAYQAAQFETAQVLRRIEDIKAKLKDIERPTGFDPMGREVRLGADVLWETWVQSRKTTLRQALALAYRDRESARDRMRIALSKLEAARRLEAVTAAQLARDSDRRSSW